MTDKTDFVKELKNWQKKPKRNKRNHDVPVNIRINHGIIGAMDDMRDFVAGMEEMDFVATVKRTDVHRMALILGLRELQKRRAKYDRENLNKMDLIF
jgi:hypothetical protein